MATEVRRRAFLIGAALVAGIVVGILVGLSFDIESEVESPHAKLESEGPGPSRELNGVPVGYARTEEGAVAAAANFALLGGKDDLLDPQHMTRAMQTLAAPSWKQEAARQARNGHEYIVETYGENANVSIAVMRYDVVDFDPDSAEVRLWTVSVASGRQRPNAEQVWALVTVELQWVENDWRVSGIESAVGPSPLDLPADPSAVPAVKVMEEFDEFEGAPIP